MKSKAAKIGTPVFIILIIVIAICITVAFGYRSSQNWRRQMSADQALWDAVEKSDLAAAQRAFLQGADANAQGDAGLEEQSTLVTAQDHSDAKMVRVLLAHGANPSLALTEVFDLPKAARLLQIGAKVNGIVGDVGWTPLGAQSAAGRPQIVALLLAHGADPAAKDKDGDTALDRAKYAAGNHPELAASYAQIFRMLTAVAKHPGVHARTRPYPRRRH